MKLGGLYAARLFGAAWGAVLGGETRCERASRITAVASKIPIAPNTARANKAIMRTGIVVSLSRYCDAHPLL